MTARDIQSALVGWGPRCLWKPNQVLAVPNSYVVGHEADLLVISKSDWVHEVEIKISASDFRAEFKKKAAKHEKLVSGWGRPTRYRAAEQSYVRSFWFAMPKELADKLAPELPDWAGLIAVEICDDPRSYHHRRAVARRVKSPKLLPARKADAKLREAALTAMYFRLWRMPLKGVVEPGELEEAV